MKNHMKILYLMSLMFLSMHMPVAAQCDSHKRIVDVHTHIIVPEYIEVLKAHGAEMEETFPLPYVEEIIAATPLAMYEYPAETTRAVVNMLAHNVPTRYPNLKIVVPHCGSFLPLALPRMKSILPAMVKQGYMQPIDWEGNMSRLYYDLAGNPTAEVIRSLLTITSPDHLLYGSDYPYLPDAVLKANLQKLKQTLFSDEELKQYADKILWKNAGQLFRAEKDICDSEMLIRISEIEVYPEYLDEYLSFARNVGAESVCKEQGVICIYPMIQKRDSCQIRILEIYASQEAYKKHIASEHFQTYKQGTLHMVKSLDLVDMLPMNPEGMDEIFKKMNTYNQSLLSGKSSGRLLKSLTIKIK